MVYIGMTQVKSHEKFLKTWRECPTIVSQARPSHEERGSGEVPIVEQGGSVRHRPCYDNIACT